MVKIFAIVASLIFPVIISAEGGNSKMEDIPSVSFCELVKNADLYFGKQVRLTATFMQATEGQYLKDDTCDKLGIGPYAKTREKLGIKFPAGDKKFIDEINQNLQKARSFGDGHAIVEVIGTLRNESPHSFVWYDRCFEILQFVSVKPAIRRYDGNLEIGNVYRATGKCNKEDGITLNIRVQVPYHHAGRIEWDNRGSFRELTDELIPGSERQIVFKVISKDVVTVPTQPPNRSRWNTTYHCEIIRFE